MFKIRIQSVLAVLSAAAIAVAIAVFPSATARADGEYINATNFPDADFRAFVQELFDVGDDEKVYQDDFDNIISIDISGKNNIKNLRGLELFKALKTLDISGTAVTELFYYGDYLEELDASGCTELTDITVQNSHLISINVSGCLKLKDLDVGNNYLSSLDLSGLTALESLQAPSNNLTSLKLNGCSSLENIGIQDNDLTALDLSDCKSLENFYCSLNPLSELDLHDYTALQQLSCAQCRQLTSLNLAGCKALTNLNCSECSLTDISLGGCDSLTEIYIYDNKLQNIDLDGCPKLKYLYCYNNNLEKLVLKHNPELRTVKVYNNELKQLDLSKCTNLFGVSCLDNPDLKKVYVHHAPSRVERGSGTEIVILTAEDWKLEGVDWKGDNVNGYTGAVFCYRCTKSGEEDYTDNVNAKFTVSLIQSASCTMPGITNFIAGVTPEESRTGEALYKSKVVNNLPAVLGHNWGPWTLTKKATADSKGEEKRTCSRCGEEEVREISKLTPTPTATPAAKPSSKPTVKPTAKPTSATPVSLKLDKRSLSIVSGNTAALKATLIGSSAKISWTSSDKKIAKVDSKGMITAKMAGTVTITAKAAGKSAECTVTVLYKDVTNSKDFWFAPANYMTAKGVVKGYADQTEFRPANACTRAQMVTFIWRLSGSPEPKTKTSRFSDVKNTDYFYKACLWGNEKGIVEGYKDGTFGPQIVCARRHAVTFLWRLAKKPSPKSSKNKFKDVKKGDYFYTATLWASEKGILAGYDDGTFRPNGNCLRRQMVTFLYKFEKNVKGRG